MRYADEDSVYEAFPRSKAWWYAEHPQRLAVKSQGNWRYFEWTGDAFEEYQETTSPNRRAGWIRFRLL